MKKIALISALIIFASPSAFASNIEITEVFPNPEGPDKNNEWIEIYNNTSIEIDIKEYKINNKDLPNGKISPHTYAIIDNIPLKNSKNTLLLTNNQNQTIDSVTYPNVIESKSYTKALINNSSEWIWTTPSKNTQNPTFRKLTGRITDPPQKNHFYFNNLKIYFSKNFSTSLIKALFKKDQQFQITINEKKELIYFRIISSPKIKNKKQKSNLVNHALA
ncbi:lamin tail domain-containing protein, partial [Candidatus Peregrinibacteria bacterium]|nr:lamin tail domain-containing protein [Candidatus Peregrinibacteria bacterium]